MRSNRLFLFVLLALPALAAAALIAYWSVGGFQRAVPGRGIAGAEVGGPFQLVDQAGRTVTDADYRGRLMLVFFGFTYCPDVCPTELGTITQAMALLGEDADQVQPIFVSIDPERDTPAAMADYAESFDPRLAALTGSAEQVAAAARSYRIYYAKVPGETEGSYTMAHTALVYLMGRDGGNLFVFQPGTSAEGMAAVIRPMLG